MSLSRSFSFSLILLTTHVIFTVQLLIFNMEHFKKNRGKPGILYEGFKLSKDRDLVGNPEDRFFLTMGLMYKPAFMVTR